MSKHLLYAVLSERLEYREDFSCEINGIVQESVYDRNIIRSGVKIDTGAVGILIPLKTLGWSSSDIRNLKEWYIQNDRACLTVIRGVETNNTLSDKELQLKSDEEIRAYHGLGIKLIANATIGKIELKNIPMRVTTDTTGNILLGMDVLKDWVMYLGNNRNGSNALLACPEASAEKEGFYEELDRLFDIKTKL